MRAAPRLAGLLAALLALTACGADAGVPPQPPGPLKLELGDAPRRGPDDAWVTVIEFSDFQCPACGSAEPLLARLLADLPADVRLVYRHDPLPYHRGARPAAEAAECARLQGPAPDGLFWPLHDLLFRNQAALAAQQATPLPLLTTLAGQVPGLVVADWEACMAGDATLARVDADVALAEGVMVRGTPTFVVNGTAVFADRLRFTVEAALRWAEQSGIPRDRYYEQAVLGR